MSEYVFCRQCEHEVESYLRTCPFCGAALGGGKAKEDPEIAAARVEASGRAWPRWIRHIVMLVIAGLVVPFALGPGSTSMVWAVALVAGVAVVIYFPWGKLAGRGSGGDDGGFRYAELVRKARGDAGLANRLIAYEQARNPSASRARHIRDAIERLDYDRRR